MTQIGLPGVAQEATAVDRVIDHWLAAWGERKKRTGPWPKGRSRAPRGFPRARPSSAPELASALRNHVDEAEAMLVIDWAFGAPCYHAKHLRGETDSGSTVYLGLANLFRVRDGRLASKLEKAKQWHEAGRALVTWAGEYTGPAGEDSEIPEGLWS